MTPRMPRTLRLQAARLAPLLLLLTTAAACSDRAPTPTRGATADAALPAGSAAPSAAGPHPFGVDDLLAMERLDEPDVSPDGKLVAFTVAVPDVAANKSRRSVWLAATDGSFARRLTVDPAAADRGPRFSADGKWLYFLSTRADSTQVWRLAVDGAPAQIDGGKAQKVTSLPVDVDAVMPFPDGDRLLLSMEVYPDAASLDESAQRAQAREKDPSKVRAYDALPVRHWDAWDEGRRGHLFTWSAAAGAVDLLKGLPYDAPPRPFGGLEEVSISKDGKEVVFTAKMVGREDAWSTNGDLWLAPADGSQKPRSLTLENPADDGNPVFSPDGTRLAYLAQARPGYESDRRRVVVMDWKTKAAKVLTDAWDRSPSDLSWAADGKSLLATADHLGGRALFRIDAATGAATPLVETGTSQAPQGLGDGRIVYLHDALRAPAELWITGADGHGARALTHLNDARVAALTWGEPEPFKFPGARGEQVSGWMVKPVGLAAGARAPVALLIHGGPQGSFGDHFHYRWNPEIFAAHGYATIMIDFHGSTGYGQAFTDAIRGDWGGAPYEDLMKGLDAALARYPFTDPTRLTALGASYGGFMINWIQGNTDRFKALVCHDGNLDEAMAYYETEELWFPEWEHGKTPWENPEGYQKHNPANLVKNWKTPELVIHGGKDYRVVDVQGMATFTALQRKGVPSRFVHFPDENHWVVKPANSRRWHQEVLGWIDRYTARK
jgi:dipeptidyl aminopeptidase/acylaminoacyl peptidase